MDKKNCLLIYKNIVLWIEYQCLIEISWNKLGFIEIFDTVSKVGMAKKASFLDKKIIIYISKKAFMVFVFFGHSSPFSIVFWLSQ